MQQQLVAGTGRHGMGRHAARAGPAVAGVHATAPAWSSARRPAGNCVDLARHLPDAQPVRRADEEQAGPRGRGLRGQQERDRADPRRQGDRLARRRSSCCPATWATSRTTTRSPTTTGPATRPRPSSCWRRRARPASRSSCCTRPPTRCRAWPRPCSPAWTRPASRCPLVSATQSDFYGKYLENPTTAKRDVWDIAPPGWIPDWFGNNGRSTIVPLLTKPGPGLERLRRVHQRDGAEGHRRRAVGAQRRGGQHELAEGGRRRP